MGNRLERLQKAYDDIEIPEELSFATRKGMERGRAHKQKSRVAKRGLKWTGSVAAAVMISLTIGVNTVPAFADSLEQIPVLGKLVKVLQFTQGSAGGGTIQDGVDVDFISVKQVEDSDQIIINFASPDDAEQFASSYNVKFSEYPSTMTVLISGARKFSAVKDLEALKQSRFVQDAYPLITLDDSAIRFNVTFKEPIIYEVKEYKDPAQVVITVKKGVEDHGNHAQVYSLRTVSQPYGETLGIAEETLFELPGLRMLKDQRGSYLVEAGYFNTEEEALAQLKQIQAEYGVGDSLVVEKRSLKQIPESISHSDGN